MKKNKGRKLVYTEPDFEDELDLDEESEEDGEDELYGSEDEEYDSWDEEYREDRLEGSDKRMLIVIAGLGIVLVIAVITVLTLFLKNSKSQREAVEAQISSQRNLTEQQIGEAGTEGDQKQEAEGKKLLPMQMLRQMRQKILKEEIGRRIHRNRQTGQICRMKLR